MEAESTMAPRKQPTATPITRPLFVVAVVFVPCITGAAVGVEECDVTEELGVVDVVIPAVLAVVDIEAILLGVEVLELEVLREVVVVGVEGMRAVLGGKAIEPVVTGLT